MYYCFRCFHTRILNIGCGKDTYGTDFIDLYPQRPEVVKCDMELGKLPYENDVFDEIIASHVLEHVRNLFPLMEELHRVLKRGGLLKVWVPHASDMGAFGHPDHKRFFTVNTFRHFMENEYDNQYSKARFELIKVRLNFIAGPSKSPKFFNKIFNPILNLNHTVYEKFMSGILHAGEVYYELMPQK